MVSYLVLGMVLFGVIATLSATLTVAQGDVEVNSNMHTVQLQAGEQATYRFRERTRIRINSSAPVDVDMDCDAMNVGEHMFAVQLQNAVQNIELTMTCRQDGQALGATGAMVQAQNRFQVRNGFCIRIQTNYTVQARIGLEMTRGEAIRASWDYYEDSTDEWVPVASSYQDGMLVADVDHFSTWAIVEGSTTWIWISVGVGGAAIIAIAAILIVKKKRA